jgi:hypothetical protein
MIGPGYIVETLTQDGLRLKGFLESNDYSAPHSRTLWIIVHGVCGNFYDSSLLNALAKSIVESDRNALRINTRGHDPVAYISSGASNARIGAAYETLSDAVIDIQAWIDWGHRSGYTKIGLLGHSLGAVKSALFSNSSGDSLIGTICISPPRLNCSVLSSDENYGSIYTEQFDQAKELMDKGKPEGLMSIRFPQPMLISAATFMDKYGSDQYDYMKFLEKMTTPTLWTFGRREVDGGRASFRDCDRALSCVLTNQPHHEVITIDDADHNYSLGRSMLAVKIRKWMDDWANLI